MATKGIVLVAGLAAAAACAPLESNEPETASASSALNANPTRTSGTALSSGHERNFGASCALWDTGVNREVVISAFGYKVVGGSKSYVNSYDVYDDGSMAKWVSSGTVSSGGTNANAAAYVAAVTDPTANDGNSAHLTTCYFAGGYALVSGTDTLYKQVWKATVASGTVTWTKLTDLNVARAKFGLSWGGTSTIKLIAVGGGFGSTRTDTIETFDRANPGTWTTETPKLNEAKHSFGFVKLSDTKFVTAGGDISASPNVSEHINAIKVNANGTVNSVGDILNGLSTVITARKDNLVVPTGKTGLGGTDRAEILVAMGQTSAGALVASEKKVVIEWNSTPAYVSDTAGSAPSTNLALPTIVDAFVSPNNATSNPGYLVLGGINGASPQLGDTAIQKWTPSTTGGSWATATTFANAKVGVNAVYIKSIDKVLASAGTDRYPTDGTDRLTTDLIQ